RLLEATGQNAEAIQIIARYQEERPPDAEMLVLAIRFASRAGQRRVVEQAVKKLAEIPGQGGVAAAEIAAIQAARAGPAAAVEVILTMKLDLTGNEPALRALVHYLVAMGKPVEALQAAQAALAAHPDEARFHEIAGVALHAAGDPGSAREELERALELDAERPGALDELAALAAEQGGLETAIAFYDRADRADPEQGAHAWNGVQLVAASDDGAAVERRLEALLAHHGTHAAAANLLAQRLLARDRERAYALARRAVRFGGGPDALDTLGRIQLERGDPERAAKTL